MNIQLIQFAYLAAAVLLILGMRNLSSAKTAPRGNKIASVGMLIAIVATLLMQGVVDYTVIIAGIVVLMIGVSILAKGNYMHGQATADKPAEATELVD